MNASNGHIRTKIGHQLPNFYKLWPVSALYGQFVAIYGPTIFEIIFPQLICNIINDKKFIAGKL